MAGKGDKRRPQETSQAEYELRWEAITTDMDDAEFELRLKELRKKEKRTC